MRVILASKSPRRRELLGKIIDSFEIITAETDEALPPSLHPSEGVRILAIRKGAAVRDTVGDEALIISSDTLVEIDGEPLGKPTDEACAAAMLTRLSGRGHNVHTGVAIHYKGKVFSGTHTSRVYFRKISDREIQDYIATGEPMDKAGAYGIQGGAALFTQRIAGDYYNVVGLPVCRLQQMLADMAPELF